MLCYTIRMMKNILAVVLCACGVFAFAAQGASTGRVYHMVDPMLGPVNYDSVNRSRGAPPATLVPATEPVLAFPGLTLADLDKNGIYSITAFFCGGSVAAADRGRLMKSGDVATSGGTASGRLWVLADYGMTGTKDLNVEYTQGTDGVYARISTTGKTLATTWDGDGYGLAGLRAARFIREDRDLLIWTNNADEAVLTLDDIKDYDFFGFMCGPHVNYAGGHAGGFNKRITTDDAGSVTNLTVEFQMLDDSYVKYVMVDFKNGANGIVGRARRSGYTGISADKGLGYPFLKDDGSYNGSDSTVAQTWLASKGYGVFCLTAMPPARTLTLDRSMTWSDLVNGVDLGARDLKLNVLVTAENPTLTFDTALDRTHITLTGTSGVSAVTVAGGTAAFSLDRLEVGKSLVLNLDAAVVPTALQIGTGSKVVYAPKDAAATVTSVISGAGGVEIAVGDVTLASSVSDYTGGTRVKSGAILRAGSPGSMHGKLPLGPFGVTFKFNRVLIESGGHLDWNGMADMAYWVEGEGVQAMLDTGTQREWDLAQTMAGLTLTGDMELDIDRAFRHSAASNILVNGHVLCKKGQGVFTMADDGRTATESVVGSGSVLQIAEGALTILDAGDSAFSGKDATLQIDAGVVVTNYTDVQFKKIDNNGTIVFIPSDATNRIDGLTSKTGYAGAGTVIVEATDDRLALLTFVNGPGRRYVVKSGCAGVARNSRPTTDYALNTTTEPLLNQRVDIESGATFDLQGTIDVNVSVSIAGTGYNGMGAFVNTGDAIGGSQAVQLTLTDDATVGGSGNFGVLAPWHQDARVELGTHTLTIDTDATFLLSNVILDGTGGFYVKRGTLSFRSAEYEKLGIEKLGYLRYAEGAMMDIRLGANGVLDSQVTLTVRNFENAGRVAGGTAMITVTDTVTATGANHPIPQLTLADGVTVKVPNAAQPLTVSKTFNASGTVTFDLAGLKMEGDVLRLLSVPANTDLSNVTYVGRNLPNGTSLVKRNGLPTLVKGGMVIIFR